ncbi:hypothetical protein [Lactococcus kimchii]|uniref:hypothetical protein n=1 Tax=Lactococcus sp. S-13 TaxID=2507158 RepID=UPI001023C7E1|nr:hypothetical protein [Lactococcus sp. S-13]RZI47889.1 hypothetical protein EQJ87_10730 [Lactococcus sp. S-13]
MNKGTKIGVIIGIIILFLGSIFAYWFVSLPKAQEVAPPKKFINSQRSTEQKIEIDPNILKSTNDFVSNFFLFDKDKVKEYNSIQGGASDLEDYYEQYGQGEEITYKIKQSTQDDPSNIFITYEVSGKYKGKSHRFSIVINVSQNYSSVPTIQNYTVVVNE